MIMEQQQMVNNSPSPQQQSREVRDKNKIFVGGLHKSCDESQLREYFQQFGTLTDCCVMTDKETKISRGFGFVSYADRESVNKVQSSRPHMLLNKQVETKRAQPKGESGNIDPRTLSKTKAFIGNVPEGMSEDELKAFCEKFGEVKSCAIKAGKPGKTPFAFVEFVDYDALDTFVENKSQTLDNGTVITCKKSTVNAPGKSPQPGAMNTSVGSQGSAGYYGASPNGMNAAMPYGGSPYGAPQSQQMYGNANGYYQGSPMQQQPQQQAYQNYQQQQQQPRGNYYQQKQQQSPQMPAYGQQSAPAYGAAAAYQMPQQSSYGNVQSQQKPAVNGAANSNAGTSQSAYNQSYGVMGYQQNSNAYGSQ